MIHLAWLPKACRTRPSSCFSISNKILQEVEFYATRGLENVKSTVYWQNYTLRFILHDFIFEIGIQLKFLRTIFELRNGHLLAGLAPFNDTRNLLFVGFGEREVPFDGRCIEGTQRCFLAGCWLIASDCGDPWNECLWYLNNLIYWRISWPLIKNKLALQIMTQIFSKRNSLLFSGHLLRPHEI